LDEYLEKATFLPYLNNEKDHPRANRNKKKFEQLNSLYMIRFLRDPFIYPRETAWFGETAPDGTVLPMEETRIFKENTFGLKTLYDQGRVFKGEIDGVHLEMSNDNI
jgi:palmitoyl-protein thioesterase